MATVRVKLPPYGPAVYIPKEDCIAHVTKRMGTTLRKLTTTHKGEQIFDSALILHCLHWYLIPFSHISHISLSLGKRLEDGGTISGTGRLTIARIDTIQSFYSQAL